MFRACMTFTLMAFFLFAGNVQEASAKTKKKKAKTSTSYVSNSKKKSKKYNRYTTKRYRRSGTGPDLRALTTEKPNTEYIENPDNGVNAVETKSEL